MADTTTGILSSTEQMKANYEKYRNKFKDSNEELVNSETFLNLMVAEMTNQDPLEPTSNTDFIAQLAQFTQLGYAQDSSKFAMANYAATLVGKIATGSKMDGTEVVTKTGVVESVTQSGNTYMVKIDGVEFDIKKITSVKDRDSEGASSVTSNALADSIAKAAGMVGMYVTVELGKDETTGATATKTGFIDSIKVKDGKISAVIIDPDGEWTIESPLDKIVEATIATWVEEPEEGDKVDADKLPNEDDKTDDEKVEGTGSDNKEDNKATDTDNKVNDSNMTDNGTNTDDTNKVDSSDKADSSSNSGSSETPDISEEDIKYNFVVEDDDPSNTNFG